MPVKWTRQLISWEPFESAGVFDVDGDGVLDIVSGAFWYRGPKFVDKFLLADDMRRYEDWYDDFSTIPMDIAGNGRLDFITGGWWGNNLRWRENPGKNGALWPEHILADNIGNIETTRAWDIDGDGQAQVVMADADIEDSKVTILRHEKGQHWTRQDLPQSFPYGSLHSLAVADFNGDGRLDILVNEQEELLPAGRQNPSMLSPLRRANRRAWLIET